MLPGPCSTSSSPTTRATASAVVPAPTARARRRPGERSVDMEDLLDGAVEVPGDGDGQGQRRVVAAGLDRVDRLPRDVEEVGQLALGEPRRRPQLPDVVPHRTSL